jgi:hypothetical protein
MQFKDDRERAQYLLDEFTAIGELVHKMDCSTPERAKTAAALRARVEELKWIARGQLRIANEKYLKRENARLQREIKALRAAKAA